MVAVLEVLTALGGNLWVMCKVERGQTGKGPSTSFAVSTPLPLQKVAGNYRSHKLQPAHQRVAGSTPPITRHSLSLTLMPLQLNLPIKHPSFPLTVNV
ncbi:hypothetical protein QQF64_014685 [Cirrhinus molitorella]|uniref:Secreted protein n=1 Tax=Cirrhinus molitorella TaxID=172907 RepID=A0ABR3NT72_9TELE